MLLGDKYTNRHNKPWIFPFSFTTPNEKNFNDVEINYWLESEESSFEPKTAMKSSDWIIYNGNLNGRYACDTSPNLITIVLMLVTRSDNECIQTSIRQHSDFLHGLYVEGSIFTPLTIFSSIHYSVKLRV